jgi:hypothetical protein
MFSSLTNFFFILPQPFQANGKTLQQMDYSRLLLKPENKSQVTNPKLTLPKSELAINAYNQITLCTNPPYTILGIIPLAHLWIQDPNEWFL